MYLNIKGAPANAHAIALSCFHLTPNINSDTHLYHTKIFPPPIPPHTQLSDQALPNPNSNLYALLPTTMPAEIASVLRPQRFGRRDKPSSRPSRPVSPTRTRSGLTSRTGSPTRVRSGLTSRTGSPVRSQAVQQAGVSSRAGSPERSDRSERSRRTLSALSRAASRAGSPARGSSRFRSRAASPSRLPPSAPGSRAASPPRRSVRRGVASRTGSPRRQSSRQSSLLRGRNSSRAVSPERTPAVDIGDEEVGDDHGIVPVPARDVVKTVRAVDNADILSSLPPELVAQFLRNQRVHLGDGPPGTAQAFIRPLMNARHSRELLAVSGPLGTDPSSEHFANRTKSIAFVLCIKGRWFQVNQDFFNQASEYNDFSGGYKRYYDELPRSFIQSRVTQRLLTNFQTVYKIPEGELILVQVQSSNISPEDAGKCLTGQGIHSDGADRAMLVCMERDNVTDAQSSVYEDAEGERPIINRVVLEEGQVLFWKDNEIYHYVEPAGLDDPERSGRRTVMIAHYPAMHYITGKPNENNTLPPSGKHPEHVTVKN